MNYEDSSSGVVSNGFSPRSSSVEMTPRIIGEGSKNGQFAFADRDTANDHDLTAEPGQRASSESVSDSRHSLGYYMRNIEQTLDEIVFDKGNTASAKKVEETGKVPGNQPTNGLKEGNLPAKSEEVLPYDHIVRLPPEFHSDKPPL